MVDQPDQFTQLSSPSQINYSAQTRMIMASLADLDELDPVAKVVDHFLVSLRLPPFDGHIVLATGRYDPEGDILSGDFPHLGIPRFFLCGEMNVSLEKSRLNRESKPFVEKFDKPVQAMVGCMVGPINERVRAIQFLGFRIIIRHCGQVWVILPEVWAGGPYIGLELSRIPAMKVPNGGG